jgi:hypothetical protein
MLNMSRHFAIHMVTLAIATTAPVVAHAQPVFSPYLHANLGDVEFRRGGWGAQLGYFARRWGIELDIDRHHHFYKDDELTSIPNPCIPGVMGPCIDSDTDAWLFTANALAFLPTSASSRWRPYATIGPGLLYAWIHGANEYNSDQIHPMANAGAGTTFRLNGWLRLRGDVRVFHVFVDESEPDGGYAEDYNFVRISLGITFAAPRWP